MPGAINQGSCWRTADQFQLDSSYTKINSGSPPVTLSVLLAAGVKFVQSTFAIHIWRLAGVTVNEELSNCTAKLVIIASLFPSCANSVSVTIYSPSVELFVN